MEAKMISDSTPSSFIDFDCQFNNTIEGTLIRYLRSHNQATLDELVDFTLNNKNLKNKYSKKYRNKNIEKLILSKLVSKQHIFIENQEIWTLDENSATEYEQKIIAEIKEINEKKQESRLGQQKKEKNKPEDKDEKLKIFDKVVNKNAFAKLDQIEEIMGSLNENAQNKILAIFSNQEMKRLLKS